MSQELWEYIDSSGQVQGPFKAHEMGGWWDAGYFVPDDKVRPVPVGDKDEEQEEEDVFLPISHWNPLWAQTAANGNDDENITKVIPMGSEMPLELVHISNDEEQKQIESSVNYEQWLYLNKAGGEVGPFPIRLMILWISNEYLSFKSLAKPIGAPRFLPVSEWVILHPQQRCWLTRPMGGHSQQVSGPYSQNYLFELLESQVISKVDTEFHLVTSGDDITNGTDTDVTTNDKDHGNNNTDSEWKTYTQAFPSEWIYEDTDGTEQGPYSLEHYSQWLLSGEISPKALLRRPNDPLWTVLESITELAQVVAKHQRLQRQLAFEESNKPQGPPIDMDGGFFYLDDEQVEQGPFSLTQVIAWLDAGYLSPDLRIRSQATTEFAPLRALQTRLLAHQRRAGTRSVRWWFMDLSGDIHGPFSLEQLRALSKTGALSTDFRFAAEGTGSRSGLAGHFAECLPSLPFYEDICEQWEYLDEQENVQGPFPTAQMRLWYSQGMLGDSLKCRTVAERNENVDFVCILERSRPAFTSWNASAAAVAGSVSSEQVVGQAAEKLVGPEAFQTSGTFNRRTGAFEASGEQGSRWARLGLAEDRAGRQLDSFYDVEQYHTQRNAKRKKELSQ